MANGVKQTDYRNGSKLISYKNDSKPLYYRNGSKQIHHKTGSTQAHHRNGSEQVVDKSEWLADRLCAAIQSNRLLFCSKLVGICSPVHVLVPLSTCPVGQRHSAPRGVWIHWWLQPPLARRQLSVSVHEQLYSLVRIYSMSGAKWGHLTWH